MLDPLLGGTISTFKYKIYLPSNVLNFKNILTYKDTWLWEDYDDLIEEFLNEVWRFGKILSYKCPHHEFKDTELFVESDSETTDNSENLTDYERWLKEWLRKEQKERKLALLYQEEESKLPHL